MPEQHLTEGTQGDNPEDIMARSLPARHGVVHVGETSPLHQLCEAFGRAVDARDGLREGHAHDAAYYAGLLAREFDLSDDQVKQIEYAALLHGIGKISLPDAILQKSIPLTTGEMEQVHDSVVTGSSWLRDVEGFEVIADLVRHQGERWDGTGYPDNLSAEAIPFGARILAVALRFAAMIRPRADRPALSVVSGALEFVAYDAGLALDPTVVRAFLVLMGREYSSE